MTSKHLKKSKLKSKQLQKQAVIKKKWTNKRKLKRNKALKYLTKQQRLKKFRRKIYIITITYLRRNVFFVVTESNGEIKFGITSGQCGFKGKNKVNSIAIFETAQKFLKIIWKMGVRLIIIKQKGYHRIRKSFRKSYRKIRKLKKFRILAFLVISHRAFNGCRQKKKRRR